MEATAPRSRSADMLGLAFWVLLTFAVASFGSQFEPGPWYQNLNRPSITPPGWIFGPVWGALYLCMSLAAWLIWRRRSGKELVPLIFFVAQLVFNGLWSWLFFGRQMIGVALADLLLLVVLVAATTWLFLRLSKLAGGLMIPYLLWVTFASVLNFEFWRLN